MAKLVTLEEQRLDRELPTVVTQATTWWEVVFVRVKIQDGLGVHPPVKVCCSCVDSGVSNWLIFPSVHVNLSAFHTYTMYTDAQEAQYV